MVDSSFRQAITMVPPIPPDPDKWLTDMPAHVIRISCNGRGLYSMQIKCHSYGTQQLKQMTNRTLVTEDQVIASLREKAIDEHAMCARFSSPEPSVLGTKRAGSPTLTSESVRSTPRAASPMLSFNSGVTEVECLERRIEHERAQSAYSATEASEAKRRQIADMREKNARQVSKNAREDDLGLCSV